MYAHRELIRLGAHKAFLRRRISARRAECVAATAGLLRPVAWLDRLVAFWRRVAPFAPFAAVPLGLLFKRAAAPRTSVLGALLRWGPVLVGAVRGLASATRRRNG